MAHLFDEPGEKRIERAEWLALVFVAVGAAAVRLLYLGQPMRYDEASTYMYFALPSLHTAVSDYSYPNNHVFHTVLVWATTHLFGNSPEAIRLPVFLSGVLAVPAAWLAARALGGPGAGLFAAAIVAAFPSLVLYSTNARAYMLVCLATLLLVWLGNRLLERESTRRWTAFVIISALGMWATPVMLYPLGGVGSWLVVEHWRMGGVRGAVRFAPRIAAAAVATLAITAVLYLPLILSGYGGELVRNKFVSPLAWSALATELPAFAQGIRELIGLGLPRMVVVAAVLVALLGMAAPGAHRSQRVTLALEVALWTCVMVVATRRLPPPRMWMFLAPLWCLYLGFGLSWLFTQVRASRVPVQGIAAGLVFVLLAARVVRTRVVLTSEETDWIGMRDARKVAEVIAAAGADVRVVISRSSGPPLDYYLYRRTGQRLSFYTSESRLGRVLLVLDRRHGQTLERRIPLYRGVPLTAFGRPALLQAFSGASIYAFAPLEDQQPRGTRGSYVAGARGPASFQDQPP